MKLSEVPFENLKAGDRVVSARGRDGRIVELAPEDDNSIWIRWEGEEEPKESLVYHHLADKIMHLDSQL